MAGGALIWGNLSLWHTRRVFKRLGVKIAVLEKSASPVGSGRP